VSLTSSTIDVGVEFHAEELLAHLGQYDPCEVIGSAPTSFVHGDIAWVVDFPQVDVKSDGNIHLRITVVLLRVDGEWRVVHSHFSEGVAHEL
jgi:hypothetical protein